MSQKRQQVVVRRAAALQTVMHVLAAIELAVL
jgi:hypothetical protein